MTVDRTSILNRNLTDVHADNRLLNRLIQAIGAERDLTYLDALELFQSGIPQGGQGNRATIQQILTSAGAGNIAEPVADQLMLLDRVDAACEALTRRHEETLEPDAAAAAKAHTIRMGLERAFHVAGKRRRQLRQLEKQLSDMDGGDASLQEVREKLSTVDEGAIRLLERVEHAAGGKTLVVEPGDNSPAVKLLDDLGSEPLPKARIIELHAELKDRHRALGRPDREFEKTLAEWVAGTLPDAPLVPEPAAAVPGRHEQHVRILERMRELGRPESEYVRTLDEMLADGSL